MKNEQFNFRPGLLEGIADVDVHAEGGKNISSVLIFLSNGVSDINISISGIQYCPPPFFLCIGISINFPGLQLKIINYSLICKC
jgi:hypothetical protein